MALFSKIKNEVVRESSLFKKKAPEKILCKSVERSTSEIAVHVEQKPPGK